MMRSEAVLGVQGCLWGDSGKAALLQNLCCPDSEDPSAPVPLGSGGDTSALGGRLFKLWKLMRA